MKERERERERERENERDTEREREIEREREKERDILEGMGVPGVLTSWLPFVIGRRSAIRFVGFWSDRNQILCQIPAHF